MKFFSALILLCFLSLSVSAQEAESLDDFLKNQKREAPEVQVPAAPALSEIEKSLVAAKAELEDRDILAKKLRLAKKMHQIRPTREQVDSAVNRAALSLPQNEQQGFLNAMRSILNYNAIERISIDAMVETYTLVELKSMVDYFSKPEAMSASRKINSWALQVQPEIARMIDKAMIRLKTGQ